VELQGRLLTLIGRRNEGGRRGVEREGGRNSVGLLRRRGFGRVARQRRPFRRSTMNRYQLGEGGRDSCQRGSHTRRCLCALARNRGAAILTSLSVNKPGQNSMSSSRSNERPASNFMRKAFSDAVSVSSFMLRIPRKCFCEFCETESRGALRFRPP
jgi:hypothetical protein